MFSARHWPWLTLYAVVVFLALCAGGLRHLELEDELSYARWEASQARQAAAELRIARAVSERSYPMLERGCEDGEYADLQWVCERSEIGRFVATGTWSGGDLTAISANPPEPSQAELAARDWQISLRWDPLRRCVIGVPTTRWLSRIADGAIEWPAGSGCGR
jgi:hypothetical protein